MASPTTCRHHPRQEPDAVVPLVRIWAGGGPRGPSLPRPYEGTYTTGRRVTDQDLEDVRIERWDFHGEWNYTIYPTRKP
jgi:hypothetical protein